jgi:SAM-dependent methyltransferase
MVQQKSPKQSSLDIVEEIARCPRCLSRLNFAAAEAACTNPTCVYALEAFSIVGGQPILIDFERSIFDKSAYNDRRGSVLSRDDTNQGLRVRLVRFIIGNNNEAAVRCCNKMLEILKSKAGRPMILIVGGGAIGSGAENLYQDPSLQIVGTDVYISPNIEIVADGHHLPFGDETFDGVWIQAVLEHVLEPQVVADEIFRVLKPAGLVYSEVPFMQHVHEGAYDFTRFTQSGHRWLFRRFTQIDAGTVAGAGVTLIWSIRHFVRSLSGLNWLSMLITVPFFWIRFLERFARRGPNSDAASGTFFFGVKSDSVLSPKDMPAYYESQRSPAYRPLPSP